MAKNVRDVMTPTIQTVSPSQSLAEAAEAMKGEDVGSVPVVEEGRLAGILTDRDIVMRAVAKRRDPQAVKVDEVASRELVTVEPEQDLDEALALMARHQVRRCPLSSRDGWSGRSPRPTSRSVSDESRLHPGGRRRTCISFGAKSASSRSIVLAVPIAMSTSPGCRTVSPEGCGTSPPSDRRSAATMAEPAISARGRPAPGQPGVTSISSIRYSGATSTTPATCGCSASRAISDPLDL
jgi:CBS domain